MWVTGQWIARLWLLATSANRTDFTCQNLTLYLKFDLNSSIDMQCKVTKLPKYNKTSNKKSISYFAK